MARLPWAVLLLLPHFAWGGTGVVRSLHIAPLGCRIRPPFVPEAPTGQAFYLIECPVTAARIILTLSSTFRLLDKDGLPTPPQLVLELASGQAKLVQVSACIQGSMSTSACTAYQFDVHRLASAQAALSQLLVTTDDGRQDCPISPDFSPSVPAYRALVPYGAGVDISVEAATGGFASFSSFAAAEEHAVSRHVETTGQRRVVDIFVVAPDQHGQRRYKVILVQQPNTDASVAKVRSNVGKLHRLRTAKGANLFILRIPKWSQRVALSATANDRQGASMSMQGQHGTGFVSAVVDIPKHVPYQIVHLRVTAADQITFGNHIIVVCHGVKHLALLSKLVVPHCQQGLEPSFRAYVYEYECRLGIKDENLTVVPTTIWLPGHQKPVTMSIDQFVIHSGDSHSVPLDVEGNAQARIVVRASDGVTTNTYRVRGKGYPLSVRHPSTTTSTTTTTTRTTVTTNTATYTWTTVTTILGQTVPQTTVPTTTVPHQPFHHWKPGGPHIHIQLPNWTRLPQIPLPNIPQPHVHFGTPHLPEIPREAYLAVFKSLTFASTLAVLTGAQSMLALGIMLKHLQFANIASEIVAPDSLIGQLTRPLRVFCLWILWPGQEESQPQGDGSGRKLSEVSVFHHYDCLYRSSCLNICAILLPLMGLTALWGWHEAAKEENTAKRPKPHLYPQLWFLPLTCVVLDLMLIPFTDATCYFLFRSRDDHCYSRFPNFLLFLGLSYPFSFCIISVLHLRRLQSSNRLVWGRRFQLFSDPEVSSVTLHGPRYSIAQLERRRMPALLRRCIARELRSAVMVADPDGGPLRLSDDVREERFGQHLEVEAGLLPKKLGPSAPWRRRQQHLDLLLWMEQFCAAHEALKQQIEGAERHLAITDVQGVPVLDVLGEPLNNLYQYCVYQFPWRPWRGSKVSVKPEPYEFEGGIMAPWVPPPEEISEVEKGLVDAWLERWLNEAETVIRARDEWRQLRVREYNPQTRGQGVAVLREMMLSLLQGTPLRLLSAQRLSEDAEERELRLGELFQERRQRGERLPWPHEQEVGELEALVTLFSETSDGSDIMLTEEDTRQPLFEGAVFGLKRLIVNTTAEPSRQEASLVNTVTRQVGGPLRTRRTPVSCELPLRHLHLLSQWMPPFGFGVHYASLSLPVRSAWAALFASSSGPGTPKDALLVDSLERCVSIVALLTVHLFAGGTERSSSPAMVLLMWSIALLALRFITSGGIWRWCLVWLPQAVFSFMLWMLSRQPANSLSMVIVDRLCVIGVLFALVFFAWYMLRDIIAANLKPRRPLPSEEEGPLWGRFTHVEGPMPFAVVVPLLGMVLHAEAHAFPSEGVCVEEQRRSICRKQLAVFGAHPDPQEDPDVVYHLHERLREVEGILPLEISRSQLAGMEEIHELACTIHVLNHVGCSWSSVRHDSFLSLYRPWGMDMTPCKGKESAGLEEIGRKQDKTQQTVENEELLKVWRQEVLDWLHGELAAAGSIKHTALNTMLYVGRTDTADFGVDMTSSGAPGIFSDGGVGEHRHCDSRCYREGRVLHYIIPSTALKVGAIWRPDPLAAEAAQLLCSEQWRPCLLRLTSRSVSYFLRRKDGKELGGPYPAWPEPAVRDHGDLVEHNVSFLFLDRVEVDPDRGLVTLQERDPAILGEAVPEYAPRCLPLVFRLNPEAAQVWWGVVKRSRMSGRRERIINYVGPVREHPSIPNAYLRHGAEGEQLWDNGLRYVGSWEAHVYHGHGELIDMSGGLIYKGQWDKGLKHGEGTYFFKQNNVQRTYTGQWVRDEFSGKGDLRVVEESLDRLRRRQPYTIAQFKGKFAVAKGQFSPIIDLSTIEPQKHAALVKAYFPTRAISRESSATSSSLFSERPLAQTCGEAPRDLAGQLYNLDGSDLAHCGPDVHCYIKYVDGTQYIGPCLAGAVPHGDKCKLIEPNGTRYEGAFNNGLRTGLGYIVLTNGVSYEGELSYPGGRRDGKGKLLIPPDQHATFGFASYTGQFINGIRDGLGEASFANGATYKGQFSGNQRHGYGTQQQTGKVMYQGPWEQDQLAEGMVTIIYSTGHLYSGQAKGGIRQGQGILVEPNGEHWKLLYEGEWKKDKMHGHGMLNLLDGVYEGQFVAGERDGEGIFKYRYPKPGIGDMHERSYDGPWKQDQQHGVGIYIDEYGYTLHEAIAERGSLKSERRPTKKGIRGRLQQQPKLQFEAFEVQRTPKSIPGGVGLLSARSSMPATDPPSLQAIDTGAGYANGRIRPPHLGLNGVPGSRWA